MRIPPGGIRRPDQGFEASTSWIPFSAQEQLTPSHRRPDCGKSGCGNEWDDLLRHVRTRMSRKYSLVLLPYLQYVGLCNRLTG
jgi:hypothetical protein